MKNWAVYIFLFMGVAMVSCNDEPDPVTPTEADYTGLKFTATGTLNIPVTHVFNSSTVNTPFALNTSYLTPLADSIKVSELSYYLTNVSLLNAKSVDAKVNLNWQAVTSDIDGYCVYKVDTINNIYTRINIYQM